MNNTTSTHYHYIIVLRLDNSTVGRYSSSYQETQEEVVKQWIKFSGSGYTPEQLRAFVDTHNGKRE